MINGDITDVQGINKYVWDVTDQTAKRTAHFWTKPAAVVSWCALWDEDGFVV